MEDGQGHQQSRVRDPPDQRGPPGKAETQQTQQLPLRPPNQQHSGHLFQQRQHFVGTPQPPFLPQAPLHHAPYDMSAMAQSSANTDYRQDRHRHSYQQQPRTYGQPSGSSRGPVVQYGGHAEPGQSFFFLQQPQGQAAPYYDSPGSPDHIPSTMPRQRGYSYYPAHGPPPAPYYYQPKLPMYPRQIPSAYSPTRQMQPTTMTGMALQKGTVSPQKVARRQSQGQSEAKAAAGTMARGPPMKPKQSGHAIWIGNLPPQTDLMSLVHHVCQKTAGLESLFLISKSNCAFANFRDEPTCLAAQQSINDTWFASVRLVARLRKNAADGALGGGQGQQATAEDGTAGQDTGRDRGEEDFTDNSEAASLKTPTKKSTPTSMVVDGSSSSAKDAGEPSRVVTPASGSDTAPIRGDRFFILKSLTVYDLECSVQTGLWATQAHNEETLNNAFKSCANVYLFFSANKSGEYFGYAQMLSETNPDPAAAIELAPRTQVLNEADLPKAIPTEATEFAPRGRMVDDATRGTAFWEALRDDGDDDDDDNDDDDDDDNPSAITDDSDLATAVIGDGARGENQDRNANADADADEGDIDTAIGPAAGDQMASSRTRRGVAGKRVAARAGAGPATDDEPAKAWGKPFRLAWLSTTRLPFYRTRGMRNPLNANREIKIARDGTEVDAGVGRKLIGLFHEAAAAAAAAGSPDLGAAAGRGSGSGGNRPFGLGVPPSPF